MSINAMKKMILLAVACCIALTGCRPKNPAARVSEIKQIEFKWGENGAFATVTLPHTVNAGNGTGTAPLLRGEGFYRLILDIPEKDSVLAHWLQFEQAGQRTKIWLNGKLLKTSFCGYTPFAVRLEGLRSGRNEIIVQTENRIDKNAIPNSGDFNFCNGIYGKLFLLRGAVAFDPTVCGIDRFHIIPLEIDKKSARFAIAANAFSTSAAPAEFQLRVINTDGKCVLLKKSSIALQVGGNEIRREYHLENPVLWQGMRDPHLYRVEVSLQVNGKIADRAQIDYGFRKISAPDKNGDGKLRLNGVPVTLRGVALHQDSADVAAAMTDADRARDQEIIRELGCNYLRCAHYPHNVNEFRAYDKMGLLCQTEIPWVNTFTLGEVYADHTLEYVREMIKNFRNHPSIALWGISNEISFPNVSPKYVDLHNEAVQYAKELDPSRPVGFVTNMAKIVAKTRPIADWYGYNTYPGWYDKENFEQTNDVVSRTSPIAIFPLHGISEYGYGGNPAHHNRHFMTTYQQHANDVIGTNNGVGGRLHPEEYQTFAHVYAWDHIAGSAAGQKLAFTAVWALFDFAVSDRNEGETPGINDKGLVTRDRKIKKDAFFFYKCLWNPAPEVHIVSSRWQVRDMPQIKIVVFSNAERVELYRNGKKIDVLDAPSDAVNRVVWKFSAVDFTESAKCGTSDVFTAVGYRNGKEIARDSAKFSTKGK